MVLLFFEVHVIFGRLVLFGVNRVGVSLNECPGAVIVGDEVALEAVVVVTEGEPGSYQGYLRR